MLKFTAQIQPNEFDNNKTPVHNGKWYLKRQYDNINNTHISSCQQLCKADNMDHKKCRKLLKTLYNNHKGSV